MFSRGEKSLNACSENVTLALLTLNDLYLYYFWRLLKEVSGEIPTGLPAGFDASGETQPYGVFYGNGEHANFSRKMLVISELR